MSDSLQDRGRALENLFFKNRDQQLLDAMREKMQSAEGRTELKSSSGIDDDSVIDALIAVGVNAETIATVGLIPLVAVAWADNKMEASEAEAVLQAAAQSGIAAETASYQLVEGWLSEQPGDELMESWRQYVSALRTELSEIQLTAMKSAIVSRATGVAEAAGGFLGMGNKISDVERQVLDGLEKAFA